MPRKNLYGEKSMGYSREQIKRIAEYEEKMRRAELLMDASDRDEESDGKLRLLIDSLAAYYGSDDWKRDFEADEAGLLPKSLKRGVLSEDGIYDLLERYRESEDEAK